MTPPPLPDDLDDWSRCGSQDGRVAFGDACVRAGDHPSRHV